MDIVNLNKELDEKLLELFVKFLNPHVIVKQQSQKNAIQNTSKFLLKPDLDEADYKIDVLAYTVLCHAIFEEYFEKVALDLMKYSVNKWNKEKIITDSLFTLISYFLSNKPSNENLVKLEIDNRNKSKLKQEDACRFEYHLNRVVGEAETFFHLIVKNNHGASLEYLLHLLVPVAIDIPQDPDILDALKKLKEARGEIAHTGVITKIPTPLEVYDYVINCQELSKNIKKQILLKITKPLDKHKFSNKLKPNRKQLIKQSKNKNKLRRGK